MRTTMIGTVSAVRLVCLAGTAWALAGCTVASRSALDTPDPAVSVGLNALLGEGSTPTDAAGGSSSGSSSEIESAFNEPAEGAAPDMAAMIAAQAQRVLEVEDLLDDGPNDQPNNRSSRDPQDILLDSITLADDEPETETTPAGSSGADPVEGSGDTEDQSVEAEPMTRERAVAQLLDVLAMDAVGAADPYDALLGVAGLEAVAPGVFEELRANDPAAFELLFDEQGALLDDAAALLEAFRSGDSALIAESARSIADELGGPPQLTTSRLELCTRVEGFGRFTPFWSRSFVAGRAQPMIVYTELDGFVHDEVALETAAGDVPGYEVELVQDIELRHAADDLLAWRRGGASVRDSSRNRVRDFYLVNQIELPATLTVGRYTLKVITRDANRSGAVSEAKVTIEIVADPSLAGVQSR